MALGTSHPQSRASYTSSNCSAHSGGGRLVGRLSQLAESGPLGMDPASQCFSLPMVEHSGSQSLCIQLNSSQVSCQVKGSLCRSVGCSGGPLRHVLPDLCFSSSKTSPLVVNKDPTRRHSGGSRLATQGLVHQSHSAGSRRSMAPSTLPGL